MGTAAGVRRTRAAASVALLGLDEATGAILADCFRQFGIRAVSVNSPPDTTAEGYEACAVSLDGDAGSLLRRLRQADRHLVIYAVCNGIRQAMPYSAYGINAIIETPVQRQAALGVVRATHLLVLHELRRYVRVPLVAAVALEANGESMTGSSLEVSAGGLSVRVPRSLAVPQTVTASFELPGAGVINVRSVVSWMRQHEDSAGLRFDPEDPQRLVVRQWIEDYLGV